MGLRDKRQVELAGTYPLVLVAPDEAGETMARAVEQGYRFLDMSAVQDPAGKIRIALLFESTLSAGPAF